MLSWGISQKRLLSNKLSVVMVGSSHTWDSPSSHLHLTGLRLANTAHRVPKEMGSLLGWARVWTSFCGLYCVGPKQAQDLNAFSERFKFGYRSQKMMFADKLEPRLSGWGGRLLKQHE